MLKATATENIPKGSVISISGNICNIITTTEQFLEPSHATFNADRDYKKGDWVEFEPRNFDDAVDSELDDIKKLLNVEKSVDAKGKRTIRKLITMKIKAISKRGLC